MGKDVTKRICELGGTPGTIFPANPLGDQDSRLKVIVYGFGLLYSFIGVSIVADMFMTAIERVTSKKRRTKIPGTNRFITTNVWNETVANLTLMALGSSAPEILLAINDILKNRFHAGALGPSTIVGSAAFNLFVIIAVCINAVPAGETRQIKETGVFFITAAFSLFAYIWLLIIVQVHTPDIVDVSEGALTFLFFPCLVGVSYASDAGLIDDWIKKQEEKYSGDKHKHEQNGIGGINKYGFSLNDRDPQEEDEEEQEETSLCCLFWKWLCRICITICKVCVAVIALLICKIRRTCAAFFHACCNCRRCRRRRNHRLKKEDGEEVSEEVEDEAVDEEREFDCEDPNSCILDEEGLVIENETGIITFASDSMEVMGDLEEKQYTIPVYRKNGLDGRISCSYRMEKFTATPGYDYVEESGVVDFKNGISKAEVTITILPKEIGETADAFQLILEDPTNDSFFNPNSDGGEECCLFTITILNANPGASTIHARIFGFLDRWINMDEMRQGSAAWYDQIQAARYVNGSPEDQEEAKAIDWLMYITFFPWNMLYAIATPPPIYLGGWVCFSVSMAHIGCLTALIGDMAELFGCAAGIPDNITAISVVALGTSLPDLFASKTAATQDEWADASIVNVTGSNSVNVFLGIGLPWLMAAIYWTVIDGSKDTLWRDRYYDEFIERCPTGCFVVSSGDLAFSVIVYTLGAIVCLIVIRVRRVVYDGELGGPANSDSKACTSCLMFLLWFFYIGLVCWKSFSGTDSWAQQLIAVAVCVPALIAAMIFFGIMLQLLHISKDYIGEEGFFGISVAMTILFLRLVYFIVFQ